MSGSASAAGVSGTRGSRVGRFSDTALAYAILPVLHQKALDAGETPPPSPFLDALKAQGWIWLLIEVGVVAVLSITSMVWDRLRTLQKERAEATKDEG